jgi:hypothetical protein
MDDPEERKRFLDDILNPKYPSDASSEQDLVLVLGAEFLCELRSAYACHVSRNGDGEQSECSFVQSFFAN